MVITFAPLIKLVQLIQLMLIQLTLLIQLTQLILLMLMRLALLIKLTELIQPECVDMLVFPKLEPCEG